MRICNGKLSGETVGGEFSGNLTHQNCLCQNVIVKPETETTQYTIQIINPDDVLIYERIGETGTLSETVSIPLLGTYTINILNATADEGFFTCLVARED